jgi:hypothetical protein
MNALNHLRACLLLLGLLVALHSLPSSAQSSKERDGQHDFDFEIGGWRTHLSRLLHPLAGSTTWTEYEGSTVVRKVWDGRANLVELQADGPAGHIAALSLRLYNPQSRQWSLDFANSKSGVLGSPRSASSRMVAVNSSIKNPSTAERSWFDLRSRTSVPIRAVLSRHFPRMAAKPGK